MRYIKQQPREQTFAPRTNGHTAALISRLEGHTLLRAIFSPDDRVRIPADRSTIANDNTRSAQEFLEMRNKRLRAAPPPPADPPVRSLYLVPAVATVLPMPAFGRSHSTWARR